MKDRIYIRPGPEFHFLFQECEYTVNFFANVNKSFNTDDNLALLEPG